MLLVIKQHFLSHSTINLPRNVVLLGIDVINTGIGLVKLSLIFKISLGKLCTIKLLLVFRQRVKLVTALVLVFNIWMDILPRKIVNFWHFTIFQI